jgi:hypothetical protein
VKVAVFEENPFGPVQLKLAPADVDEALNVMIEPTQAEFVFVVTVGAAGAPGFVIEYGPKFAVQPFPSITCTLYVPAESFEIFAVVPTVCP